VRFGQTNCPRHGYDVAMALPLLSCFNLFKVDARGKLKSGMAVNADVRLETLSAIFAVIHRAYACRGWKFKQIAMCARQFARKRNRKRLKLADGWRG